MGAKVPPFMLPTVSLESVFFYNLFYNFAPNSHIDYLATLYETLFLILWIKGEEPETSNPDPDHMVTQESCSEPFPILEIMV